MRPYLKPFSFLYDQVVGVKNSFYDRGLLKSYQASVPVVSIGNLTMGGTGKTPITDFCLKSLVAQGKKVAVISRSYRAEVKTPSLVQVDRPFAARYYGDEPVLLASANPEVAVYVGPSKWKTAQYATSQSLMKQSSLDLLIVDDGFQHRKLKRDLDIVILDATESLSNYAVVPEGRGRESSLSLSRADLVIVSKANLAEAADLQALQELIPEGKKVIYFGYTIPHCVNVKDGRRLTKSELHGKTLFLVSAIARPDVFENMMGRMGQVHGNSRHFRDHYQYTPADVSVLLKEFQASGSDYLITTEKDAVKLKGLLPDSQLLWTAPLQLDEQGTKGELNEILRQVLR